MPKESFYSRGGSKLVAELHGHGGGLFDGPFEEAYHFCKFFKRGHKRGPEVKDFAEGAYEKAELEGLERDFFGECRAAGVFFDGAHGDHAKRLVVVNRGMLRNFRHPRAKGLHGGTRFAHSVFRFVDIQRCKGQSGRDGIAAERVAIVKNAIAVLRASEGIVDRVRGDGHTHGQVASGERFAKAHDIGDDAGFFTREHRAGPSETYGDFVRDEDESIFVAEFSCFNEILDRVDAYAGCTLA